MFSLPDPSNATIGEAMTQRNSQTEARSRARAKQEARANDERLLSSGQRSVAQMKAENEVFAPLARTARVDLSASRSLS
jgi:hypothetical protein